MNAITGITNDGRTALFFLGRCTWFVQSLPNRSHLWHFVPGASDCREHFAFAAAHWAHAFPHLAFDGCCEFAFVLLLDDGGALSDASELLRPPPPLLTPGVVAVGVSSRRPTCCIVVNLDE